MGKHVMVKTVHGYVDGSLVTARPGDEKPDWVKNPKAFVEEPEAPASAAEPEVDSVQESSDPAEPEPVEVEDQTSVPAEPKKRGRPAKSAEKSLAEQAKELGIEVDPEWSDADIEARIAVAKG